MSVLFPTLTRLAALQAEIVDRNALKEAADTAEASGSGPYEQLVQIGKRLQLPKIQKLRNADPSLVPTLIHSHDRAKQNTITSAVASATPSTPPCGRNPRMRPTMRMTTEATA